MPRKKKIDTAAEEAFIQEMLLLLPLAQRRLLKMQADDPTSRLPSSQLCILALLAEGESLSVSEIARRLGIAKPNVTPLLDILCERGLIARTHDESDRRVVRLHILPEGESHLTAIRAAMARRIAPACRANGQSDIRVLTQSAQKLSGFLETL